MRSDLHNVADPSSGGGDEKLLPSQDKSPSNIILEALAPDTWYRPEQAIKRLSCLTDQPEEVFANAIADGWLESFCGDYSYSSHCWLPVINGKPVLTLACTPTAPANSVFDFAEFLLKGGAA